MPIVTYRRQGDLLIPLYGGSGKAYTGATAPNRNSLVIGVDKPGPDNTGPYTVTSWTNREADAAGNITISAPGTYRGIRYWGRVIPAQGMPAWSVKFEECQFHGADPTSFTNPTFGGVVQNFGNNPSQFEMWDCLIDPMPWVTERGRAALSPYYIGIYGGNCRVYRTEIVNAHDGVEWIGPNGSNATAIANQETLFQQNWIHGGYYTNDQYPPSDGQPHADGIQTHHGKNLTIRGNTIGGNRVMTGYLTWPGGWNAGDDFRNAALMLAQEVSDAANLRIENVLIEDNWLEGGQATINHAYKSAYPNSVWASTIIRRNRFLTRQANWGHEKQGTGPGTPGVLMTAQGSGDYIIKHTPIQASYSLNVNDQTGALVPISGG